MSQMSELNADIKELRACGENIIEIADSIARQLSANEETPDGAKELNKETAKALKKEKSPNIEEVRHQMAALSRAGYQKEVRDLITGYGVNKLSEIDPSYYRELLAKAKNIGGMEAANG